MSAFVATLETNSSGESDVASGTFECISRARSASCRKTELSGPRFRNTKQPRHAEYVLPCAGCSQENENGVKDLSAFIHADSQGGRRGTQLSDQRRRLRHLPGVRAARWSGTPTCYRKERRAGVKARVPRTLAPGSAVRAIAKKEKAWIAPGCSSSELRSSSHDHLLSEARTTFCSSLVVRANSSSLGEAKRSCPCSISPIHATERK